MENLVCYSNDYCQELNVGKKGPLFLSKVLFLRKNYNCHEVYDSPGVAPGECPRQVWSLKAESCIEYLVHLARQTNVARPDDIYTCSAVDYVNLFSINH